MNFFLFLHKPIGKTSHQVIQEFKRKYRFKKIGHHGTLDPFASGLLLVGVGEATKFFQYIDDSQKTYEAIIKFGEKTDTLDCDGQVVAEREVKSHSEEEIQKVLQSFTGEIEQVPPMYSALKHKGKRLYELAREGVEVERKPRKVMIHEIQILSWKSPFLKIKVTVSRGTYIRVLAEQIAEKMEEVAHLTELTRTKLCDREIKDAFDMQRNNDSELTQKKIPIYQLLSYPILSIDQEQLRDVLHGRMIKIHSQQTHINQELATYYVAMHGDIFIGLLTSHPSGLKPARLMSSPLSL